MVSIETWLRAVVNELCRCLFRLAFEHHVSIRNNHCAQGASYVAGVRAP